MFYLPSSQWLNDFVIVCLVIKNELSFQRHIMMWNSTATDVLEISQQTQDNINFCTSIEAKINETSVVLYHLKKKKLILVLIIKLFYWKCKCSWSLQAQSFGAIKQKIYIYSWLNFQVIPIVSFPQALGWRVNYCSGLANDLVPRVLKLDFLRRARTRLIEYS